MKLYALAALALLAAITLSPQTSRAADAALTKSDVEVIVRDYIKNNPEDILKSVQDYQENMLREKSLGAIKENKETLYDETSPMAGNPKGDVTVIEFFDYNCGYCKKVMPDIRRLIDEDKNVRVIFKDYPILGPTSETATKWALAANKQGKYYAFHQALLSFKGHLDDAAIEKAAKDAGLDVAKAKADAESSDIVVQIQNNRTLGMRMEVHGTPAFVIGETLIPGAIEYDTLKQAVNDARSKKAQ